MVFVKPTPDMRIKVSRHVDHNGKVYLPYLHEWTGANSDLLGLIQVLICTFSEQPPVYAVPPGTPQPQQQPAMPSPYGTPYPVSTPYPAMPSMPMPPGGSPVPQPVTTSGGSLGTLAPSLVRSSLLSAVEEKIRRRMDDQYLGAEIMRGTGKQLQEGRDKLERMVKDLNEEKANLERSMELCRKESRELEEEINRAKEIENEPDIDSAIVPPTPLYRQIVDSFVKDLAMADIIYYLGEALTNGKMDVDQFLKYVRQIARKQFKERALLNKCRQKAGLPG
ncbi:hypothetical protein Ocin01_18133 [Orchesella cincta]|uniref:Tumor susceptibility gene 101 protein n=1 Tax=Orchesella cincta TaxID=48709 RepID=A0A1D2M6F0_ORCCI|nr:hypothetical protein Ocin01_18133 [Orchesella cincta]